MGGIVRFILIFLFVYYLFKVLLRLLAPFIMRRIARKMQDRFYNQYKQENNDIREGDVTINDKKKTNKEVKDDMGEYVDFEEIDE